MTVDELRAEHPGLIPSHAVIDVRPEWLGLLDNFFSEVEVLYGDTMPSVSLYAAREDDGLVIDLDDHPWTGNQDGAIKQQVRAMVRQFRERTQ